MSDQNEKNQQKIDRLQTKILNNIDQISGRLSDIGSSMQELVLEVTRNLEDNEFVIQDIIQTANDYRERKNEIEIPLEPLQFKEVSDFSLTIKNLLYDLGKQSRVWIPSLSSTRGAVIFKGKIRELSYAIKNLHSEWVKLEYLLERLTKIIAKLEG